MPLDTLASKNVCDLDIWIRQSSRPWFLVDGLPAFLPQSKQFRLQSYKESVRMPTISFRRCSNWLWLGRFPSTKSVLLLSCTRPEFEWSTSSCSMIFCLSITNQSWQLQNTDRVDFKSNAYFCIIWNHGHTKTLPPGIKYGFEWQHPVWLFWRTCQHSQWLQLDWSLKLTGYNQNFVWTARHKARHFGSTVDDSFIKRKFRKTIKNYLFQFQ